MFKFFDLMKTTEFFRLIRKMREKSRRRGRRIEVNSQNLLGTKSDIFLIVHFRFRCINWGPNIFNPKKTIK